MISLAMPRPAIASGVATIGSSSRMSVKGLVQAPSGRCSARRARPSASGQRSVPRAVSRSSLPSARSACADVHDAADYPVYFNTGSENEPGRHVIQL
jgi:hypothetical protein